MFVHELTPINLIGGDTKKSEHCLTRAAAARRNGYAEGLAESFLGMAGGKIHFSDDVFIKNISDKPLSLRLINFAVKRAIGVFAGVSVSAKMRGFPFEC
jgi:hypothetical protein